MISFEKKYFIAKNLVRILPPSKSTNVTLMYHSTPEHRDPQDHYAVDIESFKKQILFLKANNTPFGALNDDGKNGVAITFDDGFASNLQFAAPFLVEHKIPFTIFVVSDFVKNKVPNYLSPTDLRQLSKLSGVTIGAHGKTHQPLAELSFHDAVEELMISKNDLEDIIGKSVDSMSFPHGSYVRDLYDVARTMGYQKIATSEVVPSNDTNKISRNAVFSYDNVSDVFNKVRGKWNLLGAYL